MLTGVGQSGGRWKKTSGTIGGSNAYALVAWDATAVETPAGCSMSSGTLTLSVGGLWLIETGMSSSSGVRLDLAIGVSTTSFLSADSAPATASIIGYCNAMVLKVFSPNTTLGVYAKLGTAAGTPGDFTNEVCHLAARWLGVS